MAVWLVHPAFLDSEYVGQPWGELWGRLFATNQVMRWFTGDAPGWSSQLNAPFGRPFWPVDPVLQLGAAPAFAIFGERSGWALEVATLFFSSGLGAYALSRQVGAGVGASIVAGLMVETCPFMLMNAADGVAEGLAFGPVMAAVVSALLYLRKPTAAKLALFGIAVLATSGSSPYFAIYGFMTLLGSVPLWPRAHWRNLAWLLVVAVVAGALTALPLLWTETGPGGRLTTAWHGGYRLIPDDLVVSTPEGVRRWAHRRIAGGERPAWMRMLTRWPGGIAVTVALLLGAWRGRQITWMKQVAALGLLALVLGPAWPGISPIQRVLVVLPATSVLGNDIRLVVVPIAAAVACLGPALKGRVETALFAIIILGTAIIANPDLTVPCTPAAPPVALLDAVRGPTVVFPSGDPPAWNPDSWPKENLWVLAHSNGASAYDFGRGGEPLDGPVLLDMAIVAEVPVGETAYKRWGKAVDDAHWRDLRNAGFRRVLVLRRALSDEQYERLRQYLIPLMGLPLVENSDGAVWGL